MLLFFYWFLFAGLVFVSFCLVMLVLLQKGRGGGLSSAFGGGGGNTAFGAKTGDVLTWATSIIFGIFVIFAILLVVVTGMVNQQVMNPPTAAVNSTSDTSPPTSSLPLPSNPTPAASPTTAPSIPAMPLLAPTTNPSSQP